MFNIKDIKIPTLPGCYLYKDSKGEIIYVGKAKSLKKRVSSYFQKKELDPKTQALVNAIRDVEFITTKTEVEALLLEQTLIHKHQPKFNIDLKGTLRYAYIKITDEKYPRLLTSRKLEKTGKYFGPYTDGMIRRQIIYTLLKIFKIRTCVKLPKKVCLQYHIGNCTGPCQDYISQEEYMANVNNAEKLLKGQTSEIIVDLKKRMSDASKNKNYELAKSYRDQLHAIENIQERNAVNQPKSYDQDVINWSTKDTKIFFQVFNVQKGVITSRHTFTLDNYDGVIGDFIRHYYSINYIPEEIVLPETLEGIEVIEAYARELKKDKFSFNYLPKVEIIVPQKGPKKDLLELVRQNIETTLGLEPGIIDLQKKLRLSTPPMIIDFFDISNLKDQYIVGACIRLKNNQFDKSNYQKFKVKTTQTQDDFTSMKEVVFRRYNFLLENDKQLPDLICIDGGRGQLNAAIQALAQNQLNIPICSLAKQEEEIYQPNSPVPMRLNQKETGIKILIKGRDEVHRFVLAFNRSLRKI